MLSGTECGQLGHQYLVQGPAGHPALVGYAGCPGGCWSTAVCVLVLLEYVPLSKLINTKFSISTEELNIGLVVHRSTCSKLVRL
eukprot:SAG31_NODE_259_length_18917_cov_28.559677_11_plen_84_part_00